MTKFGTNASDSEPTVKHCHWPTFISLIANLANLESISGSGVMFRIVRNIRCISLRLCEPCLARGNSVGGSHTCQEWHIFSNDSNATNFPPNLRCANIVKSADTYFLPNFRRANISTPVLQSKIKIEPLRGLAASHK